MNAEDLKAEAARAALAVVRSGMRIGIGTGSTMRHFIAQLGERLRKGELDDIAGVPTSEATRQQCEEEGIRLVTLSEHPRLDVAIDGTDEVDPQLELIKGLGAALLREKMVASSAERFVVIADDSKKVERLGTKAPLPVEVVPFEWRSHEDFLSELGAEATLRLDAAGSPLFTDNGNHILDCRFADGIADPAAVNQALLLRPGIVDHGLFLGMCRSCVLASPGGIEILGEAL